MQEQRGGGEGGGGDGGWPGGHDERERIRGEENVGGRGERSTK